MCLLCLWFRVRTVKIYIESLGCAKNQVDSEILLTEALHKGYVRTEDPTEADLIVVNTCGFIESAKAESIDTFFSLHDANPDAKIVGIVHAETSTGVLQPMDEIAKLTHDAGMFLLVDCVTSLGGVEVPVDKLAFDMTYSGTQKCLNCPPGLAPMTVSKPMADWIRARQIPVKKPSEED